MTEDPTTEIFGIREGHFGAKKRNIPVQHLAKRPSEGVFCTSEGPGTFFWHFFGRYLKQRNHGNLAKP